MLERLRNGTGFRAAFQKRKADGLLGIFVDDGIDDARPFYFKRKLFAAFTRKRLLRRLARFDLAAHEFPQSALRLVRGTLTDKIPPAILDDGANYLYNQSCIHCLKIPFSGYRVSLSINAEARRRGGTQRFL